MKHILSITAATILLSASNVLADVNVAEQDLNRDGTVTFEEFVDSHDPSIARTDAFLVRHRKVFENADTNGDGVVDTSESQGGPAGKAKNKDGNTNS